MLLYFLGNILKKDGLCGEINARPEKFVRAEKARQHFRKCIDNIVGDLITDVDGEIEGIGPDFDYRDKLRDADWVKKLARTVVGDHLKMVTRKKIQSFEQDWKGG